MLSCRIEAHRSSMATSRRPAALGEPRNRRGSRSTITAVGIAVGLAITGVGCSAGVAPEVPAGDPELVLGREVYIANCMSCHGSTGGGGRGTKLNDGRVIESFDDPADQVALVAVGRGAMPGFEGRLSGEEIDAVVRYTREALAG